MARSGRVMGGRITDRYIYEYIQVCTMQAITKTMKKTWYRLCDKSESVDHLDSVISIKIINPIKDAIYEHREARRLAKQTHWSY